MRHFIVGATLLIGALVVTFGVASVLQGMAAANRPVASEPFVIDKIKPAATVNRPPRSEPAARSVSLGSRRKGV
ncbi:hypothetical protein BH10PSE6_BH10PSE6_03480 [soil metagenome]